MSVPEPPRRWTFVLKLKDKPGDMELIAATFAHRGISLRSTSGNDGQLDPEGRASVTVTFLATPTRKETLKMALSRLTRVVSVVEAINAENTPVRKAALIRLAPEAEAPALPSGLCEPVGADPATGEISYSLIGSPEDMDAALDGLQEAGHLRAVTYAVLAL